MAVERVAEATEAVGRMAAGWAAVREVEATEAAAAAAAAGSAAAATAAAAAAAEAGAGGDGGGDDGGGLGGGPPCVPPSADGDVQGEAEKCCGVGWGGVGVECAGWRVRGETG